MSATAGPLQVVPDVDDQSEDHDSPNQPSKSSSSGDSDFEQRLKKARQETSSSSIGGTSELKALFSRRRPGAQLPMRRLTVDAQPLTPMERRAYSHLLPPS